jgi:hypothetical protein
MNNEPSREVVIFIAALKLPPVKRAAFLDQACAGDENLRRKVAALLDAHERAGNFLEKPPFEAGAQPGTPEGDQGSGKSNASNGI